MVFTELVIIELLRAGATIAQRHLLRLKVLIQKKKTLIQQEKLSDSTSVLIMESEAENCLR